MNFRLSDLKNFIEVANSRTMREAAEKLQITQPSLSESIKRLEEDLEEVLFYRSRSGVSLTPGGKNLLNRAGRVFSALSEIETSKSEKQLDSRVITIGCHETVASYCLPQALQELQNHVPDYRINLRHDFSRNIQTQIQQGQIDLGIVVNVAPSPDLIIKPVAKDEVCVWKSKDNVENKIFCNLELIQTQVILRKWKNKPHNIVHTNSLELIVRLTNQGLGLGIIPSRAVEVMQAKLQQVPNLPTFKDSISIVYRPEFGKNSTEKFFIEAVRKSLLFD